MNNLINFILVLISIYVSCLFCSVYLYNKYDRSNKDKINIIRNDHLLKIDELKTKNNKNNIYPTHNYEWSAFRHNLENVIPFGEISNSTIVYGYEETWSIFKTDKYGFYHNNDDSYIEPDIILLGDSFAKGCCTFKEFAPKNIFEKKGIKTLSLASGGGTLIEYATYLEYGREYRNKTVILFFYEGNDYSDLYKEYNNKTLFKYLTESNFSQNLKDKQNIIDEQLRAKFNYLISKQIKNNYDIMGNIFLKYFFKYLISYLGINFDFLNFQEANDQMIKEVFNKLNNELKKNNNQLFIVHLPISTRFNYNKNIELDKKKNRLFEILNDLKINYLDFTIHVRENKLYEKIYPVNTDEEMYPIDKLHFNHKGYEELVEFIIKKVNY